MMRRIMMLLLSSLLARGSFQTTTSHPMLYIGPEQLPALRTKVRTDPYFMSLMQQYEGALLGTVQYSAGGVFTDVQEFQRVQLASAIHLVDGSNATEWGKYAKSVVLRRTTTIANECRKAGTCGFAANQREIQQLIACYDVIYDLFTASEVAQTEAAFATVADILTYGPPYVKSFDLATRLMNPNADRLAAIGLIGLALPAHANASRWRTFATAELRWMLRNGVMADGQWHEPSTRYGGRVLAAFIPLAYALRRHGVMDAFRLPAFRAFVGWVIAVQTPRDRTMGGCALTPALSDGNVESVWEANLGWAAGAYARTDPSFAAELWDAWQLACSPADNEPSPSNHLAVLHFVDGSQIISLPSRPRPSRLLTGYAVLREPTGRVDGPYLLMSTATQRQTEGHEHPDRGSINLWHEGTPLIADPGDGWSGYQWDRFPNPNASFGPGRPVSNGAWYRGSESHSMVWFRNSSWHPKGGYHNEWGLRGPAWVTRHLFTDSISYVDLNTTRAVRVSQSVDVRAYHRRVFAAWSTSPTYLLWDAIDAPAAVCANATYNLHVITSLLDQVGASGGVGCTDATPAPEEQPGVAPTVVHCAGLNEAHLDVTIVRPSEAARRGLLTLSTDPLPIQFTGVSGRLDGSPYGGAFAGDWNAAGTAAPEHAHWPPRQATWLQLQAAGPVPSSRRLGGHVYRHRSRMHLNSSASGGVATDKSCHGFITVLQPRNTTEAPADVEVDEELPGGAATVRVRQGADAHGSPQTTLYLLGSRPAGSAKLLSGVEPLSSEAVAAVVGWTTPAVANATEAEAKKGTVLEHVELIDGKLLQLSTPKLRIALSTLGTVTIDRLGFNQYRLKQHSEVALVVELTLPWRDASTKRVAARGLQRPPRVANVWRGAHVWHSANSSGTDEQAAVTFEALPGEEYLVETQCRWVEEGAGYGEGGWLCDEFE